MVYAVPDILSRIVDHKRATLAEASVNRGKFERQAVDRLDFRDFRAALIAKPPAIVAEIKQASPSLGTFVDRFDPPAIASTYESGGAAALSVLTDSQFFKGTLADLEAARAAVAIPVLRKDFTIDEFHVIEAAAHGADAILLIAALLDASALTRFRELAERFKMAALIEVHNEEELEVALASGPGIIGVNNRNLHTFEVTLETSLRLADKIPSGIVKISESGIHSAADVHLLTGSGYHAFLVGEHVMRSSDPAGALRALRSP